MRGNLSLALVAVVAACGGKDAAAPPLSTKGSVRVTVRLHGNGVDTSGFTVTIGSRVAQLPVGTTQLDSIQAGAYNASLGDVATHCFSNPAVSLNVSSRDTVSAEFDVTCIGDIAFEEWVDTAPTISYLRPDGRVVRVTSGPGRDHISGWSPDGTRLVFESNRNGQWDIYTVRIDGTGLLPLTNDFAEDHTPRWSPDGQSIVYRKLAFPHSTLHVINADGTGDHVFLDDQHYDFDPTWAHGDTIVFSCDRYGVLFNLCAAAANGTGLRLFSAAKAQHAGASPDGSYIAYEVMDSAQTIWVAPLSNATPSPVNLTPSLTSFSFAWSPDGHQLVVSTCAVCTNSDYLMQRVNRDGTGLMQLSAIGELAGVATFSRDGTWIVFDSFKGGSGQQLRVMKPDGSEDNAITASPTAKNHPSFNPASVFH